jgi:eukaryotic-like serine/threonine-protein kinase
MGLASVPPPPPPVQPGDVVAGKYRVERAIAAGGMGLVFSAKHIELDQAVALKFMRAELRGQISTSRFTLEARATAKLRSAHIARVYDVGVLDDGTPFMVMELLEGIDLERLREERGRLSADIAAELISQACDAVSEAHNAGIIHRDLKPANLFLTKTAQGAPFVKVLDFGISKAINQVAPSATQAGTIMGSPPYMSPETLKSSRNADARSDIWALGVILYELVTGKLPFDGEGVGDLALKVHHDEPHWPCDLDPDIPKEFDEIVRKCLKKDATQRFKAVAELREALHAFSSLRSAHGMTLSLRTSSPRIVVVDDRLDGDQDEEPIAPPARNSERARKARAATTLVHGAVAQDDFLLESPPRRPNARVLAAALALGAAIAAAGAIAVTSRNAVPTSAAATNPPTDNKEQAAAPTFVVPHTNTNLISGETSTAATPPPVLVAGPAIRGLKKPTAASSSSSSTTAAASSAAKVEPAPPPPPPAVATAPAPPAPTSSGKALRDRGF